MTQLAQGQKVAPVDRQEVPRTLRRALYALLLIAGALSVPRIGEFGPLPTTTLLDVWIVLFLAASFFRGRTTSWVLMLLLVGYGLVQLFFALATESPMYDFFQAYRWVLYLVVFAFAIGRRWGPIRPLVRVTWALIAMALLKAVLTFIFAREGTRPGLLLENNFELALFCGLAAVMYRHLGRGKGWIIVALGALTILAGSRSGAVAFLVLALYAITQIPATRANLFQRFLLLCSVPVLVLIPAFIFASRMESVRIDRLNFLDVFLYETHNWDLFQWLFGTVPITPLTEGCLSLSYYIELFSSTGNGDCYSVILHAFLLRVVFDAGLFGLVLTFGVIAYSMRKAGAEPLLVGAVLGIAITNSLSVSGPNNPYVALPILLAVLTATASAEPKPQHRSRLPTRYQSTRRA